MPISLLMILNGDFRHRTTGNRTIIPKITYSTLIGSTDGIVPEEASVANGIIST